MRPRVIPLLLIENGGLVKTVRFRDGAYLGDPINTIKIFNDLEVDEVAILDISASRNGRGPDLELLGDLASEAFFPMSYGGGVRSIEQISELFSIGFEKVILNTVLQSDPEIISRAAERFGSQSVVASIDVKKNLLGTYKVYDYLNSKNTSKNVEEWMQRLVELGAGEIVITDVEREGSMQGFNEKVATLCGKSQVPVVFCGGAGDYEDLATPVDCGAHAVGAGSLFVFQNKMRGVLVNYPSQDRLDQIFSNYLGNGQ